MKPLDPLAKGLLSESEKSSEQQAKELATLLPLLRQLPELMHLLQKYEAAEKEKTQQIEALAQLVNGLAKQLEVLDPACLKRWQELPNIVETMMRRDRQREELEAKRQAQYTQMYDQWQHLCSVLGNLTD